MNSITLVLLGTSTKEIVWSLGDVHAIEPTTATLADYIEGQLRTNKESPAYLFWDSAFGQPDEQLISQILAEQADVWHGGLSVGTAGHPGLLDFVSPTWHFNCDIKPDTEGTSWRLSLRCCLIRTEVIRHLGGPNRAFISLDAAGLELGYRCLLNGAVIRYTPRLMPKPESVQPLEIGFDDELRFVSLASDRKFCYWAVFRAVFTGYVSAFAGLTALRRVLRENLKPVLTPYPLTQGAFADPPDPKNDYKVSVLIPTLDRYPYLRTVLNQLRNQTIPPLEIIVVDQTDLNQRDYTISGDFSDLPLRVIYLDEAGQCSSRNVGLQTAIGDYVLFIDDDDEIQPDLIEKHLQTLCQFKADSSSGSVDEAGALPLPPFSRVTRMSDVFPTSNTMIHRAVLNKSGLFDMAFERRQSEDGDLGMRLYLSGATMIYNPRISVYHHRASRGGLRVHKARVITYSSSRQKLFHRRLPHVSEIYIHYRYFSLRQIREADWLTIFGTFFIRGTRIRKILKIIVSSILLPDTLLKMRQKHKEARVLLEEYPQIPELHAEHSEKSRSGAL